MRECESKVGHALGFAGNEDEKHTRRDERRERAGTRLAGCEAPARATLLAAERTATEQRQRRQTATLRQHHPFGNHAPHRVRIRIHGASAPGGRGPEATQDNAVAALALPLGFALSSPSWPTGSLLRPPIRIGTPWRSHARDVERIRARIWTGSVSRDDAC